MWKGCGLFRKYNQLETAYAESSPRRTPGPSTSGGISSSMKMKQLTVEAFVARPVVKMAKSNNRVQVLTRGITEFVAKDLRPIGVVEGEGFQRLIQMLEPAYTVPSRKTISKELKVMQEEVKENVTSELGQATYVALTTDFWSSFANDSYLGVTCHFISPQWELRSYVLQTREVTERHTGENMAQELQNVVDEWDIHNKLVATTTDNGRNVVSAVVTHLQWQHLACAAHTLQIAVKSGLSLQPVSDVLKRCRKLVGHFRHSIVA